MDAKPDQIKERVQQLTNLLHVIQARLVTNINDVEAVGMLDEVISQLEELAEQDQGIDNILYGLHVLQKLLPQLRGE